MPRSIKATALVCALVVLLVIPALAASPDSNGVWHLKDCIDHQEFINNERILYYEFNTDPWFKVFKGNNIVFNGLSSSGQFSVDTYFGSQVHFYTAPLGVYSVSTGPLQVDPGGVVDISDLAVKSGLSFSHYTSMGLEYRAIEDAVGTSDFKVNVNYQAFFYDKDGYLIDSTSQWKIYSIQLPLHYESWDEVYYHTFASDYVLDEVPSNTCYVRPIYCMQVNIPDETSAFLINRIQFDSRNFFVKASYNMLLDQSETMQAIDDKLGEANDKLDDLLQQPEQEKQEASSSGGDSADKLASAIPDKSSGFMAAIAQLTNSMRYSGTDAKLTVPAITLPEIPGVMPSYQLSTEQEIDFGFWVNKMPSTLLELCRILLTLGLIFYSFKELYSLISYAMTLKGGGSDV